MKIEATSGNANMKDMGRTLTDSLCVCVMMMMRRQKLLLLSFIYLGRRNAAVLVHLFALVVNALR